MDIKCKICGEPWDIDELHERIKEYYPDEPWRDDTGRLMVHDYDRFFDEARLAFSKVGCEYFGTSHNVTKLSSEDSRLIGELYDLAGDDIDFAASMLEEADQLGLFE